MIKPGESLQQNIEVLILTLPYGKASPYNLSTS